MDEMSMGEFRPPDNQMIDYMLSLTTSLNSISLQDEIQYRDSQTLKQASHSMKILLAMAVSGSFLFSKESQHADALYNLSVKLYDMMLFPGLHDVSELDVSALEDFRLYREDGADASDIPFFSSDDD